MGGNKYSVGPLGRTGCRGPPGRTDSRGPGQKEVKEVKEVKEEVKEEVKPWTEPPIPKCLAVYVNIKGQPDQTTADCPELNAFLSDLANLNDPELEWKVTLEPRYKVNNTPKRSTQLNSKKKNGESRK